MLMADPVVVPTLEEDEYPNQYHRRIPISESAQPTPELTPANPAVDLTAPATSEPTIATPVQQAPEAVVLKEQHLVFQENQRGVSFDDIFGPYLAGSKRIVVTDPYIRLFHQLRNLMDLMETISKVKDADEEVTVHAITAADDYNSERQTENLQKIADACLGVGIQFTWEYDTSGTKHDRDITTDHGWKIVLSRGIDVFQRYELNETFNFANRLQQYRPCKEFNVTYVRVKPVEQKN